MCRKHVSSKLLYDEVVMMVSQALWMCFAIVVCSLELGNLDHTDIASFTAWSGDLEGKLHDGFLKWECGCSRGQKGRLCQHVSAPHSKSSHMYRQWHLLPMVVHWSNSCCSGLSAQGMSEERRVIQASPTRSLVSRARRVFRWLFVR